MKMDNVPKPFGREQISWKGEKNPTKEELRKLIKQYEEYSKAKEEESRLQSERLKLALQGDERGVINAADYFLTIPESQLCKNSDATTVSKARHVCNEFGQFLRSQFPNVALHEVRTMHVEAYFSSINKLGYSTLDRRRMRLNFIFRRILVKYVDSPLPYRNPFDGFFLEQVKKSKASVSKERLSVQMMRAFLAGTKTIGGYTRGNYRKQLYALAYFHSVTGWRSTDITGLKWSDVDLENRLITVVHKKTVAKKIRTKLYITDIMMDILVTLREICKDDPLNIAPDYVFPLRQRGGSPNRGVALSGYEMIKSYMERFREEYGLTKKALVGIKQHHHVTLHSLRDSVIQELSQHNINPHKIDYLVGHSTGDVNSTHYLNFEVEAMRSTKDLVEIMEKVVGAEFWNESARIEHEKNELKERVRQMRAGMKTTEGGIMFDIDPETGQRIEITL